MIKWEPGQTDIVLKGQKIRLLGDPHQGRRYVHGVPLHRRGDRERLSAEKFEESFSGNYDLHICMGDIFDSFVVPPEVVLEVARVYRYFAENLNAIFILIRGNHDASRDADKRSSFDVLKLLLSDLENVYIADEEPLEIKYDGLRLGFLPWHPFITARQMVDALEGEYDAVFGHWDVESYGQENDNLIPTEALFGHTSVAFTGHVHKSHEFERDNVRVIVTGSMLPQAHGEEIDDGLFVTTTLDKLDDVRDKCVRLVLKPGEEIPEDLDCLQLVVVRVTEKEEEIDLENVELGAFDLKALWEEAAEENSLDLPQTEKIWGVLDDEMKAQG